MTEQFFEKLILDFRRPADFITPVPKPKKRRCSDAVQASFTFGEGFTTTSDTGEIQTYNPTEFIRGGREQVDQWRGQTFLDHRQSANDPCQALKAEMDTAAWESLHLGDEVMKVFSV